MLVLYTITTNNLEKRYAYREHTLKGNRELRVSGGDWLLRYRVTAIR